MIQHGRPNAILRFRPEHLLAWGSLLLLAAAYFANLVSVDSPIPSIQIAREEYRLFRTKHTLGGLVFDAAENNALIAVFCVLFFLVSPIVRTVCHVLPRTVGDVPVRWKLLRVVSHWDLLPLLAMSLLLLSLLGHKDAPSFHFGVGFYMLVAREALLGACSLREWRLRTPEETQHLDASRAAPLMLSAVAFVLLIVGLVGPAFYVDKVGFLREGPKSIAGGIRLLFEQGSWALAGALLLFSVVFPLSKIVAFVWAMCFHNRISKTYLTWLEILGPLSLLDAIVLVLFMVAYSGIPLINATLVPAWAYWSFVSSVFLNSLAVSLSLFSRSPIRTP